MSHRFRHRGVEVRLGAVGRATPAGGVCPRVVEVGGPACAGAPRRPAHLHNAPPLGLAAITPLTDSRLYRRSARLIASDGTSRRVYFPL